MATRSTIAIEFADGTVDQIYCHSDGYLSYNGRILRDYYTDPFKVQKLMEQGDLSVLGLDIGQKINFDDRMEYNDDHLVVQCRFYSRDRGETGVSARKFADFEDYRLNHQYEEFEYILRQIDGKAVWFVSMYGKPYIELTKALEQQKEEA